MNRFWDWALETYGRAAVAEACLRLQDAHGQNVPLLLWAAWARIDDPARMAQAAGAAHAWETAAIAPLRAVRRGLKAQIAGLADPAREDLRGAVKGVELQAERLLMAALEPIAETTGGATTLQAMTAAAAAWGRPVPDAALRALDEAIGQDVVAP